MLKVEIKSYAHRTVVQCQGCGETVPMSHFTEEWQARHDSAFHASDEGIGKSYGPPA